MNLVILFYLFCFHGTDEDDNNNDYGEGRRWIVLNLNPVLSRYQQGDVVRTHTPIAPDVPNPYRNNLTSIK